MADQMRITHDELQNSLNTLEGQINALPEAQRPAIVAIQGAIKVQIDALLAAINALPVANGVDANGAANGAANGVNGRMNGVENGAAPNGAAPNGAAPNGAAGGRRRSKKHGKKHRKSRRHH